MSIVSCKYFLRFQAKIPFNSFAMPAAGDDFQLDLLLEITLSNGTTVTAEGGSWYSNNGELDLVVG